VNPRFVSTAGLTRLSLRMQRDEHLVELAGLGSEAAFEAIVHRYRPALVRHCAQIVGHDDADEAVQDTLMKAHRALARGTSVHSLGAWLHAVAHNSALSLLRGRRAATEYRDEHEGVPRAIDGAVDLHEERLEALLAALRSLPHRQRRALVMREFEGRSYEEIAVQLGASNGAVRQLLNRARASVRARLAALIPGELVLRWASATGGAARSGALTLAGGGAFAAKLSSAILLSAMPVVAVNPIPAKPESPPPAHRQTPAIVRTGSHPAHASALRPAAHLAVAAMPRLAAVTAPRRMSAASDHAAPAGSVAPAARSCQTVARAKAADRPELGRSHLRAPEQSTHGTSPVEPGSGDGGRRVEPGSGDGGRRVQPGSGSGGPASFAVVQDARAGQAPSAGNPGGSPGLTATTADA
jgi:RNA polymerase sigma factor (sigma-70 family)